MIDGSRTQSTSVKDGICDLHGDKVIKQQGEESQQVSTSYLTLTELDRVRGSNFEATAHRLTASCGLRGESWQISAGGW